MAMSSQLGSWYKAAYRGGPYQLYDPSQYSAHDMMRREEQHRQEREMALRKAQYEHAIMTGIGPTTRYDQSRWGDTAARSDNIEFRYKSKAKPKTLREQLQLETDKWLKGVKLN